MGHNNGAFAGALLAWSFSPDSNPPLHVALEVGVAHPAWVFPKHPEVQ